MNSIAVLGYGYWGPNVARTFRDGGWEVVVVDPDERALSKATRQGFRVASAVPEECLAMAICSPPNTHEGLVGEALSGGRHVWTEKPLAGSPEASSELIEEAERRGLVLMVDHTFTFAPVVTVLSDVLKDREVHHVEAVRAHLVEPRAGATVIGDLLPHDASILRACGLVVQRIRAVTRRTYAHVACEFVGGATGSLYFSWVSAMKLRRMALYGEGWTAVYDHLDPLTPVTLYEAEGTSPDPTAYRYGEVRCPTVSAQEPLRVGMERFTRAIREGESGNAREAVEVQAVVACAEASAARGGAWVEAGEGGRVG